MYPLMSPPPLARGRGLTLRQMGCLRLRPTCKGTASALDPGVLCRQLLRTDGGNTVPQTQYSLRIGMKNAVFWDVTSCGSCKN
jgi:hypothetical protein